MVNRREVLLMMASAPLLSAASRCPLKAFAPGIQFVDEDHVLARESKRGFQLLIDATRVPCSTPRLFAPGIRELSAAACRELLQQVHSGAQLILESGVGFSAADLVGSHLQTINEEWGLKISPPVAAHGYVHYAWPVPRMVRTFEFVTPVCCAEAEVIARWNGLPVCFRRRIGHGSLIYLGSMLGPGLFAEEREAHELGRGLLA